MRLSTTSTVSWPAEVRSAKSLSALRS